MFKICSGYFPYILDENQEPISICMQLLPILISPLGENVLQKMEMTNVLTKYTQKRPSSTIKGVLMSQSHETSQCSHIDICHNHLGTVIIIIIITAIVTLLMAIMTLTTRSSMTEHATNMVNVTYHSIILTKLTQRDICE